MWDVQSIRGHEKQGVLDTGGGGGGVQGGVLYRYHLEWVISSKKTKVSHVPCTACKRFSEGGFESMRASYFKEILKEIFHFHNSKNKHYVRQEFRAEMLLVCVVNVSIAAYVHLVVNECNEVFALNGCKTIGVRLDLLGKQKVILKEVILYL